MRRNVSGGARITLWKVAGFPMSPVSIVLIAVSLSFDSFFAAVGRGAGRARPHLREIALTGLVFAVVQMVTPLLGWGSGTALSSVVAPIDHWLAFGLLAAVGGRMISGCGDAAPTPSLRRTGAALLATAVGTSIDALAVGVSLAFLDVDIVSVTLAIGAATFIMTAGGMMLGQLVGQRYGRLAEVAGGVVLIGLGLTILIGHLAG